MLVAVVYSWRYVQYLISEAFFVNQVAAACEVFKLFASNLLPRFEILLADEASVCKLSFFRWQLFFSFIMNPFILKLFQRNCFNYLLKLLLLPLNIIYLPLQ